MGSYFIFMRFRLLLIPSVNDSFYEYGIPLLMLRQYFERNLPCDHEKFGRVSEKPKHWFRLNPLDHQSDQVFKLSPCRLLRTRYQERFANPILGFLKQFKKQSLFGRVELIKGPFSDARRASNVFNTCFRHTLSLKKFAPYFPQGVANQLFFFVIKCARNFRSPLFMTGRVKWS